MRLGGDHSGPQDSVKASHRVRPTPTPGGLVPWWETGQTGQGQRPGGCGSSKKRGTAASGAQKEGGTRGLGQAAGGAPSSEGPSESHCGHRALGLKTSRGIGGGRASQAVSDPARLGVPARSSRGLCLGSAAAAVGMPRSPLRGGQGSCPVPTPRPPPLTSLTGHRRHSFTGLCRPGSEPSTWHTDALFRDTCLESRTCGQQVQGAGGTCPDPHSGCASTRVCWA